MTWRQLGTNHYRRPDNADPPRVFCPWDGTRLEPDDHGRLVCPWDGWTTEQQPS